MRIGLLAAAVAVGAWAAMPPSAGAAVHATQDVLDERLVAPFLRELQVAVARDNREAVAARVQYPLIVFAAGMRIPIVDAASLIQTYDVVFSPALKAVIAEASLPTRGRTAPKYPVAVVADAVIVGDEVIRIQPVGGALKVTGIKVPLAPPSALAPAPATPAPSRGAATSREPRRLSLRVGQARLSGALAPGARDAYVVSVMKNQLLEVRIDGVSGRAIVARIVNSKNREPLDARARDGVRTWTGRVPEDTDYRIDVVRLAPAGEPRLPYVIVISLR